MPSRPEQRNAPPARPRSQHPLPSRLRPPPQQTQQYQQTYQQPQYAPPPQPQYAPPQQPPPGGIICPNPNCRYVGPGKTTGGMNCLVFLVLLLLGFIPALIYLLVCPKEEVHCPRCGTKIR